MRRLTTTLTIYAPCACYSAHTAHSAHAVLAALAITADTTAAIAITHAIPFTNAAASGAVAITSSPITSPNYSTLALAIRFAVAVASIIVAAAAGSTQSISATSPSHSAITSTRISPVV